MRKRAEAQRTAIEEEYAKTKTVEKNQLSKYSISEAAKCVMDAELRFGVIRLTEDDVLPVKTDASYDIFDIYKASVKFDGKRLEKYPEEGPGSDELKKVIDEHRADLEAEYQKSCKSDRVYFVFILGSRSPSERLLFRYLSKRHRNISKEGER